MAFRRQVGAVGVPLACAVAQAARQAREAHGGDGGRIRAQGGEPCDVAGALQVKGSFGVAVDADEGMIRFAAAGVDGDDRIRELGEDAQPDGGRGFVGFEDEVGVAGAAGGVATAQAGAV